jgi:cell division protein FtsB
MDSINGALQEKEKLNFKKRAYEIATINNKALQEALPQVLDLARESQKQKRIDINENLKQYRKLKNDITELERQIKKLASDDFRLEHQNEARELVPLLKYIEKRAINGRETDEYMQLLIDFGPNADIEKFIQETKSYEKPAPTSIMSNERQRY